MRDPLWICDSLSISGLRFDAFSLSAALIECNRAEKGFIFNATTRQSRAAASAPKGFTDGAIRQFKNFIQISERRLRDAVEKNSFQRPCLTSSTSELSPLPL